MRGTRGTRGGWKTKPLHRTVGGTEYLLQYKTVRRLNLRVAAENGEVFVSAPAGVSPRDVDAFVQQNERWIEKQRLRLARLPKQPEHRYETGETLYLWGKPLELQVWTNRDVAREILGDRAAAAWAQGKATASCAGGKLLLACPPSLDRDAREKALEEWFRRQLEAFLPYVFQASSTLVGKRASSWYVRKMSTRWGTCNVLTGRVCVNLALVHLPPVYLNYVVLHELTHLWYADHGPRFQQKMDAVFPAWRERRREMKRLVSLL
ncbi:MAG: SprT family zinc-dependent metalloprotease [Succiniclasticum sp.]|nr:SprT family zinc-dependent metalloprotease [Succiniclasticum sp.]